MCQPGYCYDTMAARTSFGLVLSIGYYLAKADRRFPEGAGERDFGSPQSTARWFEGFHQAEVLLDLDQQQPHRNSPVLPYDLNLEPCSQPISSSPATS